MIDATAFDKLKEKIGNAVLLDLNKLKNHARRLYAVGDITHDQWIELERIANERYNLNT